MTRLLVKRVAIIGAGPSGLAAAKYLVAEHAFASIDVYEQRSSVGGVWNYVPIKDPPDSIEAQYDPHQHNLITPMYDQLETNLPAPLMQFSDLPFKPGCQLFPRRETVRSYIDEYAQDIRHLIKFRSLVRDVRLIESREKEQQLSEQWRIESENLDSREVHECMYDAVVVANGHYNEPYVPRVEGLREWEQTWPHSVSHSMTYRRPDCFRDKVRQQSKGQGDLVKRMARD